MRIRTDDEVYRVDAVWLGPPKATFPFRARYVAYGVGVPLFFIVLGIERQLGISFGFFSTAWALVMAVLITKLITAKINHDRPLGASMTMLTKELSTPRETTKKGAGGAVTADKLRMRAERPRPSSRRDRGARQHQFPQGELIQKSTAQGSRGYLVAASRR
jgi:hypothetical protein